MQPDGLGNPSILTDYAQKSPQTLAYLTIVSTFVHISDEKIITRLVFNQKAIKC